ncbi:MAG: sulfate adenylyltransferase [Alphaproteobacteria bacterium]|nr:sulfate adenylyltransferase [Alphaproteobacteria bacterium]
MSLVPVHGGLNKLVDRVLPWSKRKSLIAEAADMPKILVTDADLSAVYRFSDGTLSPLDGPMDEADWNHVLDNWSIVRGGTSYAWSIPLALPVTDDEAATLKPGHHAALVNSDGEVVGVLRVSSVYDWDKARYIESVYKTTRTDHPGGHIAMNDERTKLVGGEIETLPQPVDPHFGDYVFSPTITRAVIADRGYDAALAFQTRNPLHRAHEYALVHGAQELTRAGKYTGVFLNPLVGQLKGDDVDAVTRMKTYANLKANRLLGQGDSDTALWDSVGYELNDVFHLVGLDIKMFYGGPAEAVMHAIYRQNHGFTNIVIGRQHADAPYDDGGAIWGPFDAHEIFDNLGGELHIQPVKVGFAAYYPSMGRVDLMDNHTAADDKPLFISGKAVRSMLVGGELPPTEIMRPPTAEILIEAYRAQGA